MLRDKLEEKKLENILSPHTLVKQIAYIPRALKLVWRAAPYWASISFVLLIIQGLTPVMTVYLTRYVVNSLVQLLQNTRNPDMLQETLASLSLLALVLLITEVLTGVTAHVRTTLSEHVQDLINLMIQEKAVDIDLQFYESSTYYDQLQRARIDAVDRPLGLFESLENMLQNTVTLLAMGVVLLAFTWWMPFLLLIGTLPALWASLRTTQIFHRWRLRNTLKQRRLNYYNWMIFHDQAAAEFQLFDVGRKYIKKYHALRKRMRRERLLLSRNQMSAQIGAGVWGLISLALALAWMAWQAFKGGLTLGDMAMGYQAMNLGQRLMRSLLTGAGDVYRNLLFLSDLFFFLDLQPQLFDPDQPSHKPNGLYRDIRLSNVTFQYPGSSYKALNNFSLKIPSERITAVVGENGAGKSTLIKLLCRFYDPDQGEILWDDVNLQEMRRDDLRRRITVLFQRPVCYNETVADNISFGEPADSPDRPRIEAAARAGGAEGIIDKLSHGYDTMLGKRFGHTELSIGEWQRIALSRAFLRKADLVILDEPTSAMDSWAEIEWMKRFRGLISGRTALIITHRLSTAKQADMIYVMDKGRIIEAGSHDDLVLSNGRYAQSWRYQVREADFQQDGAVVITDDLHEN